MPAPRDHAALEAGLHAALWQPGTPAGLASPQAERRFAVYRNNVQHGLSRALAARFPVVARLVGAEFFAAMARVHAATEPPRSPVLHEWGAGFAGFLDGFPPVAGLPWLGDVARLEWLRGLAFHAADAPAIDPAALTRLAPDSLRLTLAPSVQGFASRWPVVSIWQAHQPGAPAAAAPPPVAEHALIARAPGFAVVVEPLDPGSHATLCALMAGRPLAEAATHDPTPLLALLLRHGLIADLTGDPA